MADINGVSFVLQSLNQLLEQDADLLNPKVEDQIRSLQSHLSQIISFLRQHESRKNTMMPEEQVVTLARNVIHEAEVIIHTLAVDVAKQRMRSRVGKFFHFFGYNIKLRKASTSLRRILTRIRETIINEICVKEEVEIGKASSSSSFRPVGMRKKVEEDDVLGFQDQVKDLVTKLTNAETRLQVVSIVGEAGLGKTTLAKKVYHHGQVKHHFSCCAWVHVSQNCGVGDLLRMILEDIAMPLPSVTEKWGQMKERELMDRLSECFQGSRKYLIVMDDLRSQEMWTKVKSAFPDEGNGSRIMLTTRPGVLMDENVSLHNLCPLDVKISWKLLCKRLGGVESGRGHDNLEATGRSMVKKCSGSPLSIQLLSGVLATKEKTREAWSRLNQDLMDQLSIEGGDDHDHVINFNDNLLSYVHKSLAHHLSFCFLYFGMFPRGVEIPVRQLVQLWIAEGFIQQKGTIKMEDVGEEYLEELIGLSLIRVTTRRTDGGVKACRIHDIFQEFCISKGKRSSFFEVSDPKSVECGISTRRLAIHAPSIKDASVSHFAKYSDVRSFQLSIQDHDANLQGRHWSSLSHGFKLLRVLNLGFVCVHRIPRAVGRLIHLRYLKIKSPGSKHVPPSVCNLLNLQTLDLRESSLSSMPDAIWKLQQLRHLHLGYVPSLPEPPATDKSALESLQTLSSISTNKVTKLLMVKAKFPNIRRLKIVSQSKQETDEFLKSIDHLFHLQSLKIISAASDLPDPNAFPLTLTKITLLETSLSAESVKKLERLPNLQILKLLKNSVVGEEINCSDGGFSQLQVLHFVELETLIKWSILEGNAMVSLRHLVIRQCAQLTTIPDHQYWPNMREVDVFFPSPSLRKALRKFTGVKGRNVSVHPPQDLAKSNGAPR